MKTTRTQIRELKTELHYHQQMVRVDIRAVRAGMAKCRAIAARMRELQLEEINKNGKNKNR